jgi:moderate conductance mechanosensitive channel
VKIKQIIIGILIGLGLVLGSAQSWAQSPSPSPSGLQLPQLATTLFNPDVQSAPVKLDGRRLFTIAASTTNNSDSNPELGSRLQNIESRLTEFANQARTSAPEVTFTTEPTSNLPILSVDQQYLMTVTTLDAQLQGQQPEGYARQLTQIIRNGLIRARQERQPDVLMRQALIAIAIIFGMSLLSWLLSFSQRRLRQQQKRIHSEIPSIPEVADNTSERATTQTQLMVKQQLTKRQQHTMKDVQRRLLQITQLGIWAVGGFFILGLFPYTRPLQTIVLSTPLKVAVILALVYLLIRLSDLIIDRIFSAFNITDWSTPTASQRIALRISTFSRITRSLAAIAWVGIGVIVLLSVVGIQIIPLLAGAGIIGLGISLASQSLIKDIINGFFILFEDQYAVGDVIKVGAVSGFVEHMSLRITQLRDAEGRLITIPNSTISVVENLSKDWSRVDLSIAISYDADVDRAIAVIYQVGQEMTHDAEWQSRILESPEVLGVDALNSEGITLRIWIKTQPLQQWKVGREFRRRLKHALDQQGIEIAVPQQALSVRGALDEHLLDSHSKQKN